VLARSSGCEDEADAKQLYWTARDGLPKRFSVGKTPTSASGCDLSSGNGSAAGT
jgi:hypothetical protein